MSCRDYWDDLTELARGNLVETDNERTAYIMYRELTAQMVTRMAQLRYDGVTREEIKAQIADIREHLQTDFRGRGGIRSVTEEEISELWEALGQAEGVMGAVFKEEV